VEDSSRRVPGIRFRQRSGTRRLHCAASSLLAVRERPADCGPPPVRAGLLASATMLRCARLGLRCGPRLAPADHHRRLPAETRPLTPAFQIASVGFRYAAQPPTSLRSSAWHARFTSPPIRSLSPPRQGTSLSRCARPPPADRPSVAARGSAVAVRKDPPAASIWLRFRPLVAVAWWAASFPAATRAVMPKAAPGTAPAAAGPRCAGDPAGSRHPAAGPVHWT
jgi:hypothetical protein